MVTDGDGLGDVSSAVTDEILAVSVFVGCGKEDGSILTAMQSFLLKQILSTLSQVNSG